MVFRGWSFVQGTSAWKDAGNPWLGVRTQGILREAQKHRAPCQSMGDIHPLGEEQTAHPEDVCVSGHIWHLGNCQGSTRTQ